MSADTSRRIWLCADDYGMAPGIGRAIRDLVVRGRLNATSVMVVAPSFAADEARLLKELDCGEHRPAIGLHLTLTAPFRPLTSGFRPLRRGAFLPLGAAVGAAFLGRYHRGALAAEIEAQFAAFAAAFGRPPDFVDGHQHVHLLPGICDAVFAVARRRAPGAWLRQCGNEHRPKMKLQDPKGWFIDRLSREFRRRTAADGLSTNTSFAGTYRFQPKADFATLFPGFLQSATDGGVIMCHPGFVDSELERLDPLTTLREREHAYLAGSAVAAALARSGIVLAQAGETSQAAGS